MMNEAFKSALDDRAESFLQVGDVTKLVAEKHCGVTIDEVTHQRWRQTLGLLREIDTLHDDTSTSDDEILDRLVSFDEFTNRYPDLSPGVLEDETKQIMVDRVARIFKIGSSMAHATSLQRFVALRILEGKQTAAFLRDSATKAVTDQLSFEDSFMPTVESMAVTANLLDSFTDAQMDQRRGSMQLKANAEFYKAIVSQIPSHSGLGFQALLHVPILQEFGVMSWNRLTNRIKLGKSATTSLDIWRS